MEVYFHLYWWWWAVVYCTGLCWAVLGCTGLYWAVLDYTGLYWSVLDCTVLYCAVLDCTGLYWAVRGCTGLYWDVLGCSRLLNICSCHRGFHYPPISHWWVYVNSILHCVLESWILEISHFTELSTTQCKIKFTY